MGMSWPAGMGISWATWGDCRQETEEAGPEKIGAWGRVRVELEVGRGVGSREQEAGMVRVVRW